MKNTLVLYSILLFLPQYTFCMEKGESFSLQTNEGDAVIVDESIVAPLTNRELLRHWRDDKGFRGHFFRRLEKEVDSLSTEEDRWWKYVLKLKDERWKEVYQLIYKKKPESRLSSSKDVSLHQATASNFLGILNEYANAGEERRINFGDLEFSIRRSQINELSEQDIIEYWDTKRKNSEGSLEDVEKTAVAFFGNLRDSGVLQKKTGDSDRLWDAVLVECAQVDETSMEGPYNIKQYFGTLVPLMIEKAKHHIEDE